MLIRRMSLPRFAGTHLFASLLCWSLWLLLSACASPALEQVELPKVPQTVRTPLGYDWWQWATLTKSRELEEKLNFRVSQVPAIHVLDALSQTQGLGYEADECGLNRVSLRAQRLSLDHILNSIEAQTGSTIERSGGARQLHLRLRCEQEQTVEYALDQLDLKRTLVDQSSLSSALDRRGATTQTSLSATPPQFNTGGSNSPDTGNQSRLSLVNQHTHDVWERLALQLEFLLQESSDLYRVSRQEIQSETSANVSERPDVALRSRPARQISNSRQGLETRVQEQIRYSGNVIVHPESATVTVRAKPSQHRQVKSWLDTIGQRMSRQVLVEAVIAEINLNRQFERGIDWNLLKRSSVEAGLLIAAGPSEQTLLTLALRQQGNQSDLNSTLRLLEQFGQTRVISSPRVMTMNQQAAVLKVIDNRVYFTTEVQTSAPTNNNPSFSTFNTVAQTVPVGFLMSVTAQIADDQSVQLRVRPTLTRIVGFVNDPNPALRAQNIVSQIPEIQTRELEALLRIKPGEMMLLGGLKQDSSEALNSGLPGVEAESKWWAGRERQSQRNTELIVLLKATVLDSKLNAPSPTAQTPAVTDVPLNRSMSVALQWAQSGQLPTALELMRQLLDTQPQHPSLLFNMALLQVNAGQTQQALTVLSKLNDQCKQSEPACSAPLAELLAWIRSQP